MSMKLAFIGDWTAVEADARFAREHGFEGIEYNHWGGFRDISAADVQRVRAALDAHGVRASMLGLWGWNHLSPDAAERRQAHEMLRRLIDFAGILGADCIVTGCGDIPGEPVGRKVAEFASVFAPVFERAEKTGLKIAFYALHGGSFIDSLATCERLWEVVPQVKLKFDPANWQHHGDDYLEVVRRYGHKIGYIHIKEHLSMGGRLVSQPPAGMGDIAWGRVMAFLYEHNYDGWLSIEPHGPIWSRGEMRMKMILLSKRHIGQYLI